MSDLNLFNTITAGWSSYPLVIAVMIASIAGSSHCISMCGPVSILLKNNRGNIHLYNLGRLLSYLLLGFVAGTVGKEFLNNNLGLGLNNFHGPHIDCYHLPRDEACYVIKTRDFIFQMHFLFC